MKRLGLGLVAALTCLLAFTVPAIADDGSVVPAAVITVFDLDPDTATNPVSTSHTVTATYTVTTNGVLDPQDGVRIEFTVTGINAGAEANGNGFDAAGNPIVGKYSWTNANGIATWSYSGGATPGDDTITGKDASNEPCSPCKDSVSKTWERESVPSMTQWGLFGLISAMTVAAVLMLRRKYTHNVE